MQEEPRLKPSCGLSLSLLSLKSSALPRSHQVENGRGFCLYALAPQRVKWLGIFSSQFMDLKQLIFLHPRYFAPGGILDSQTTETQWMRQYSPADLQLNQLGIIFLHHFVLVI